VIFVRDPEVRELTEPLVKAVPNATRVMNEWLAEGWQVVSVTHGRHQGLFVTFGR